VKEKVAGLPGGILPLMAVNLRRTSAAEGVRAALAVVVLVALNEWLQWPAMREAGLAALFTCLCDPGGPIRQRLPTLLGFGVLGTLATVGFGLLRGAPLFLVVPVATLGVFCAFFARAFGQATMLIGNLLTVVLVLALATGTTELGEAAEQGAGFLGGNLWATLLTLAIWRVYPYRPARRAVADVYRALADLVGDLRGCLRDREGGPAAWEAHARGQRRRVREALELARNALLATAKLRGAISSRAAQTWIRLETADQIFAVLIGLADRLEASPDPALTAAAERLLRRLRPVLLLLARDIESERGEAVARLDTAVANIAAAGEAVPDLRGPAVALADRLRQAVVLSAPEGWQPGSPPGQSLRQLWQGVAARVRANLDWHSAVLRHALRGAAAAVPAFTVTLSWPTSYGHWLTIMLVMTLQPFVATTFARALERVAGTIVGGFIAAGLAAVCTTPLAIAAAMFPLAVAALALKPASFGLYMTMLTPLVVLLSELGRPGESEITIALMRALYTLIGSALAAVAVLVLWPSWEPERAVGELRTAVRAHGAYANAAIGALLREVPRPAADAARRAAGIASNNLEASLQRALVEPGSPKDRLAAALTVDAALRRLAGRVSALLLEPAAPGDAAAWRAWGEWLEAAARRLAAGHAELPRRPALPQGDPLAESLTRMARQMEVAASAMQRLV
jgi:uncharacterized membrane protein YccC